MTTRIAGFSGSLRHDSLNRWLVAAARNGASPGMDITVFEDVARVPLFDEDLEGAHPSGPGSVHSLRALIARSDGILISTPEYNQSIPGVTKNVVDWLSRPEGAGVLACKPAAIMGATTGQWGTRYAQKELRHALMAAGAIVMPQPMLFVARADASFDAAGDLIDPAVRGGLAELLGAFDDWIRLVGVQARRSRSRPAKA